uniref:HSF_DOMAIN domain-containing protein n=1 Tax=Heligmosomoides polygyrus TaxID=6339 RepID=A0A183FQA1_HELPZ
LARFPHAIDEVIMPSDRQHEQGQKPDEILPARGAGVRGPSATLFTSYCTEPATSAEKHSPLYPAATSSSSLFHGDMLGATPSPPVNMWNSNIHSKYLFDYAEVMMTIPTFLDAFFGRGRVVEWESGDTMLRKKCVRSIRRRRRRSVSAAVVLCVCVGGIPLN